MTRAGIADLKNNLSRYLAFVRGGGEVAVFDRETPIARIVPFASHTAGAGRAGARDDEREDERLADMERQGVIKRGDRTAVLEWLKTHRPVRLPRRSGSVVETLLEMRREDAR